MLCDTYVNKTLCSREPKGVKIQFTLLKNTRKSETMCSYLAMRQQSVVVNGTSSHSIPVKSEVPQGSVLGPLLFLIYIDCNSTLQLSEGSNHSLYADDMLLYKTISSAADYVELQQDIDEIYGWSTANLMTFNSSKCKCMFVSRKRNLNC